MNCCPACLSFACCLLYLYLLYISLCMISSLVIGMHTSSSGLNNSRGHPESKSGWKFSLGQVFHTHTAVLNRAWCDVYILICREHKNMPRIFLARCHHGVCCWIVNFPMSYIKLDQHLVPTGHFFVFHISDDVRNMYAKKTADEIPAEGNCQQFLQGVSVWAAWKARVLASLRNKK